MGFISLKEITLEWPSQPGYFPTETDRLALELSLYGQVVGQANFSLCESNCSRWAADRPLILRESDKEYILNVFLQPDTEERQLLGCIELRGVSLYSKLGESIEVPLKGDRNLVLKTRAEAIPTEDALGMTLNKRQEDIQGSIENEMQSHFTSALDQLDEFEQSGNLDSLEQSILQFQRAAGMASEADTYRLAILSNLGLCFFHRFQRLGGIEDLENAITQKQAVVTLTPDDDPSKPIRLNNLGNSLATRFEHFGNAEDIDSAIVQHQAALDLTPAGHSNVPTLLSNLGNSLKARFERFGNIDDINTAITRHQAAVDLTPNGDPNRPTRLNNLGSSLSSRFERLGSVDDIDSAISQHRAALILAPNGHPDRSIRLNKLGDSLRTRFTRFGNVDDIDSAIAHQQAGVSLTPDRHPHKSYWLSNLGDSFFIRFKRFEHIEDIDSAIAHQQAAIDLVSDGHPGKSGFLDSLGSSFSARFKRLGNIADIDRAVARHRTAIDLTTDNHPDKPIRLNNLGNSLLVRFERLQKVDDIDGAITQYQAAVTLTPDGHPHKPFQLTNLGNSLSTRYKYSGNLDDNDRAIELQSLAVNIVPPDHPEKPTCLHNLGGSLFIRFLQLSHNRDAEAAISHFSAAALSPIGSPSQRLDSAQHWILVASLLKHKTRSLLAAYECAIKLIPLVAWLGLSIKDRHQHLMQMGTIARDAAALAICFQYYDTAIEWLEQGRSIVWSQVLQLRTPVDRLHDVDPGLADKLLRVSRLLDGGVQRNGPQEGTKGSSEEEGRRYRVLAKEWETTVEEIRSLPDFQDFLRPSGLSRLMGAANNRTVVIVNTAPWRCDALALKGGADEVIHIPLPDFTLEKATQLQADLKILLKASDIRQRAIREPEFGNGGDDECKRILGELWTCLVKPVLDSLSFGRYPDTLPHIWWCVTGPLAFLPIHAAGDYDEESADGQIYDYVISSYTPTLTALLESPKSKEETPFKMTSVIEPSTGRYYIPNTKVELEHIQRHLKDRDHYVLEGPNATKERVMEAMKDCHWLHLACHGSQNVKNPTKSALKLRDGDLDLEEIIKLDLPQAEFAYLSACQTVTGDEQLSEESVHIAGGMLLAGYRSVVATMWSIEDKLAPEVADEFYGHLMEDRVRPDSRKTAEALHLSIQKLRKNPKIRMVSWIPFVHIGV